MLACRRFEAVLADADSAEGAALLKGVRDLPSRKHMILIALISSTAPAAQVNANFTIDKPVAATAAARSLRVAHGLMLAERQRYYRHAVSIPVALNLARGQQHCATATDLSEGGMAVHSETPLPVGRSGLLRFTLDNETIEVRVEVAWSDNQGCSGLRFSDMPRAARVRLNTWLADHFRERADAGHVPKAASA